MRLRFSRAEALPALALGVPLVAEAVFVGPADRTLPARVLLASVTAVGMLWRTRLPLVTLAVALAAPVVRHEVGGGGDGLHYLAVLVAVYSVGAHGQRRDGLVTGALLLALLFTPTERAKLANGEWGALIGPVLSMVLAFGLGRLERNRTRRALAAEQRATLVERDRDERARTAVAEERARIARELHDIVAHHVSVMVIQAQAGQRLLGPGEADAREALTTIETTGRDALVELRRLLGVLRRTADSAGTEPQPGLAELPRLIGTAREAGLAVELHIEGEPAALPAGLDLSAYRIVQEAVTNAMRYAATSRTQVLVRYCPDAVELEISDDGPGSTAPAGAGHGLAGMRERASLYGGVLEAGPRAERGFAVRARLPR
ncbi:MAG: sensor histidine kinase [Actinomycetes bacterium]